MKPIEKILFPVDLSDISQNMVPLVLMMAEKFNAQIYLLFVVPYFEYLYTFQLAKPEIEDFSMSFIKGAENKIKEFKEDYFKEYPKVRTEILSGDPSDTILDYIDDENIDLVIMGTHGRKGLNHIITRSKCRRKHSA